MNNLARKGITNVNYRCHRWKKYDRLPKVRTVRIKIQKGVNYFASLHRPNIQDEKVKHREDPDDPYVRNVNDRVGQQVEVQSADQERHGVFNHGAGQGLYLFKSN